MGAQRISFPPALSRRGGRRGAPADSRGHHPSVGASAGDLPVPYRARRGQRLRRQGRTLRELAELGEGLLLQLPDALPAKAEHVPNLLETLRLARFQPIAQPQNKGLALGQVPEAGVHAAAHLLLRYEDLGLRGLGILQDILERRALVRDRLL